VCFCASEAQLRKRLLCSSTAVKMLDEIYVYLSKLKWISGKDNAAFVFAVYKYSYFSQKSCKISSESCKIAGYIRRLDKPSQALRMMATLPRNVLWSSQNYIGVRSLILYFNCTEPVNKDYLFFITN
jgi:hypothetical protein